MIRKLEDSGMDDVLEDGLESRLDKDEIISRTEEFFGDNGLLCASEQHGGPAYEPRPQQAEMALKTAAALLSKRNLCIEAPTGVGKSFAYLVPAALYALKTHKPVVISTETISLQEQLITKDIPLLQKLMGTEFVAVLAKGRANYLCRRRLGFLTGGAPQEYLPFESLAASIGRIAKWADKTEDGTLSSIGFAHDKTAWDYVCCEVGNCTRNKCHYNRKCFYWNARRKWDRADIIVANHALFFTDLKIRQIEDLESTLLPEYSAVILDESHKLEDSAAQHLGLAVSSYGVRFFLRKLFDPEKGKGILLVGGPQSMELRRLVAETMEASEIFFDKAREVIAASEESILRVLNPDIVLDCASPLLARLEHGLTEFVKTVEDDDFKQELTAQIAVCGHYRQCIHEFITMGLQDHVYWMERKGEASSGVTLSAAPLNVAEVLRQILFSREEAVVLTSATLSVSKKLDYYFSRVGFSGGDGVMLGSPFDYKSQMRFFIPKMPLPDDEDYFGELCVQIERFIRKTHGKAFVLFTSYDLLRKCAARMRPFFDELGVKLLVQGEGKSPTVMLQEFREDVDSVIFGTASFWMGVDVPGKALSNVIITKLPFAVPDHPLAQARSEKIEADGGNSFTDYSLPEAVLKFKQGIGRLIRRKTDTGIVVVLDRRIVARRYGKAFLESVPECPVEHE